MPIYEYQCSQCKERQEVIQKFSDAPLAHCPSCGGDMKKLPSSPAIQFKGSGFYKTDYASSTAKGETKSSETKTDSKSEPASTSTEAKTETTKSETKTEAKSVSKSAE